jgi:ATP synthase protein I
VTSSGRPQRTDILKALQRDAGRRARREVGHRSFWRSLGVLGMVGWPIALASVGGALLGHYLDRHWNTGVQFTLMILTAGTMVGSFIAWQTIRHQKS